MGNAFLKENSGLPRMENGSVFFQTSGSTGKPKSMEIPLKILEEEADIVSQYMKGRKRIISVMPRHHLFGFVFSVLLPKRMGIPVEYFPPLPLATFFEALAPGDLLLAFPVFWRAMVDIFRQEDTLGSASGAMPLPHDLWGMSSTSPLDPAIKNSLLGRGINGEESSSKLPLVDHLFEIYGSTETSAVGIRQDAEKAYTLLPLWQRKDEEGANRILRILPEGMDFSVQDAPDSLTWLDDQHFLLGERKDNAVQVGGINVYPERVAAYIRKHELVADCMVRLMRPEEGERLKAFIVPTRPACQNHVGHASRLSSPSSQAPQASQDASEFFGTADFRAWLSAGLSAVEMPKKITVGDELPRNNMGKLSDW